MDKENQPNLNKSVNFETTQEFLNAPYIKKIEEAKNYFSFLNNNQLKILNIESENKAKNVYESLLNLKNEKEITPLSVPKEKPEFNTDFLFKNEYTKSLKNNYESINDLKRKEDELRTLAIQQENSPQILETGKSSNNNMNSNIVNNNMYVTNVTPDYLMNIKRKSQSPPGWRDSAG